MRSVMIQTWSDIEYIVVDGASTDGTQDVIRQNEALFDGRLKWVSEQDGGIYDAMNQAVHNRFFVGEIDYIRYFEK